MKDFVVRVEAPFQPARDLVCDFCGEPLEYPFYAYISVRGKEMYLMEYFCEKCLSVFKAKEVVDIKDADEAVRDTIYANLRMPYHGVIVEVRDMEEASFLINNPFLIYLWGEKF